MYTDYFRFKFWVSKNLYTVIQFEINPVLILNKDQKVINISISEPNDCTKVKNLQWHVITRLILLYYNKIKSFVSKDLNIFFKLAEPSLEMARKKVLSGAEELKGEL